ncbi:MAG TPA: CARDB domain-containing protein [Solirubrobacteraceae bacterium]|jgi:dienelactone hydrolase
MARAKLSLCLAVTLLGSAGAAPPSTAAPAARPDLTVARGSVRAVDGRLVGSFRVRNSGRRAPGSSTTLSIKVNGNRLVLGRFKLPALRRKGSRTVEVARALPAGLPPGSWPVRACADGRQKIRERRESNNCRAVGVLRVAAPGTSSPGSSFPSDPVPYESDAVFALQGASSRYWVYVPDEYDSSHHTPATLFVWLHRCGGKGEDDIYTVAPRDDGQDYVAISLDGREGVCWEVDVDTPKVLDAIADVKTHLNIDPRRVVLGGYSSGGDLTYRTAFYNADAFAGVLVENSSPFRDTGSSQTQSLAAASWKFNVVHLAHEQDDEYPVATVRDETGAMRDAGFPVTLIVRAGGHYDPDAGATGTDHDLRADLLPHLEDNWLAPER